MYRIGELAKMAEVTPDTIELLRKAADDGA